MDNSRSRIGGNGGSGGPSAGFGDILDNEINNQDDRLAHKRSTNLLSDAGSKFEDDMLSHYMGQSEYGGISNMGGHE